MALLPTAVRLFDQTSSGSEVPPFHVFGAASRYLQVAANVVPQAKPEALT
jgi:hypothetical protein